jgi:4-diphosphocytidyl-2C-methyl-D-erythritol kinase
VIAAMSGSGSGVFGLFESKAKAGRAKAAIVSRGWHAVATRTLAGSRLVV